jgi:hypothetical protein
LANIVHSSLHAGIDVGLASGCVSDLRERLERGLGAGRAERGIGLGLGGRGAIGDRPLDQPPEGEGDDRQREQGGDAARGPARQAQLRDGRLEDGLGFADDAHFSPSRQAATSS